MKLFNRKFVWFAIIAAIIAVSCDLFTPTNQPLVPTQIPVTDAPIQMSALPVVTSEEEILLIELYKRANPAVVNIVTYTEQQQLVFQSGQGSGFVFDQEGHIITNSHVVHGVHEIEVVFSDNSVLPATVIGEDPHSDLAVIKVDQLPEGVHHLPLGEMKELAVGQTVVAIGNPFGLGGTLTKGIISALGRTIPALTAFSIPQSIQTDAPINPGNSGGPLLNLKGEVIGVNAQIETDGASHVNSGIGFAIPISIMSKVIPELIENGECKWSWVGVTGRTLTPSIIEAMHLTVKKGAYISSVVSDGPSEQAGLRGSEKTVMHNGRRVDIGGDVIIRIDGVPVNSFEDLLIYTALSTEPNQEVILIIVRDNKELEIKVTVRARPNTLELTP